MAEGREGDTVASSELPPSEHRTIASTDGTLASPPGRAGGPGSLAAGVEFAGHRIVSEIGRGGMGIVYRALHVALDRERALKLITPALSADRRFRERFQRESRLAATIEHPNVVPVHTAGEEDGRLYISMRVVEGPDLGELVATAGPLDRRRAADLIVQTGAGLDAAHAQGLVHRDVKPSNVMVELGREGERAFITDFGISRLLSGDSSVTNSGEFVGSVDYVSPEQIEGRAVDQRADVYSLAAVAHFMLTGEPPFPGRSDAAKLLAHAQAARPRASKVAPGLDGGVDRAIAAGMAIEPGDRPESAGELAAILAQGLTGRRRRPWGRLIAGALALAAVAAGLFLLFGDTGSPPEPAPSGQAIATIEVGGKPAGVATGPERMWAATAGTTSIDGISPQTNELDPADRTIGSGEPVSAAVGFEGVWVVDRPGNAVVRLDPEAASVRIPVGEAPVDIVIGGEWVWVANQGSGSVSQIDPASNAVVATVDAGTSPKAIAYGDGRIWVVDEREDVLVPITASASAVPGTPVPVGRQPVDVAYGEDGVWVVDNYEASVRRFDPQTLEQVGPPIPVGPTPRGIAVGLGSVWVANGGDDTLTRIDPLTGEVIGGPIPTGSNPADVAVGFDSVWTADYDGGTVTRIEPTP